MYSKCAKCESLGVSCRKVNILSMATPQAIEFLKLRKKFLGVSNQQIADATKVPVGTVARFFAFDPETDTADFMYDTMRRIAEYLMGYTWDGEDCPTQGGEQTQEIITQLEQENEKLRVAADTAEQQHREEIAAVKAEASRKIDFLREQIKFKEEQMTAKDKLINEGYAFINRKNKLMALLSTLLAVAVCVIIGALIVDKINPNVGFIWTR